MKVDYPIISADSHITEPPNTYTDFIDPAWRDRAPHMVDGGEKMGDMFVVEGSKVPIPMGLVAAAGKDGVALDRLVLERVAGGGPVLEGAGFEVEVERLAVRPDRQHAGRVRPGSQQQGRKEKCVHQESPRRREFRQ